jgi:hypothetical protein
MKIYLVSRIKCWSDEIAYKDFWCYSNKQQALDELQRLVDLYVCDLCDYYDLEYNSLELLEEEYITVVHNGPKLFIALTFDGTEEIQIELTELELL